MASDSNDDSLYLVQAKNEHGEFEVDVGIMDYPGMYQYAFLHRCAVKGIRLRNPRRASK